jgi:hypothetical protein
MAFPTTSVLTNFTQADGNASGFTVIWSGDNPIYVTSNQARCNVSSGAADGGWNAGTYGPDCEAYATIPTLSSGKNLYIYARLSVLNTASAPDAYRVKYNGTDTVTIEKYSHDGYPTQLGASISVTLSAGDKLGISCVGSTITAWRYTSGAWASLGARTDSTYSSAGYIGIEITDTTYRLDDFGGGTVSSGSQIKVAGKVAIASVKVAGKVAIASVKKFMGVSNS